MRFSVRREDRRSLVVGFLSLMMIMTAHSVMETARDTLFLTKLPATDLPGAYLAIALVAIAELTVHRRLLPYVGDRRALLAASLFFGALVTLGFWAWIEDLGPWGPFGFYVWTGLLITVVLIELWLLLDDSVTVTQAKRIFPAIAAGGVVGAMLGSLLSEGLLRFFSAAGLVLAAALILVMAAASAFLWRVEQGAHHAHESDEAGLSVGWLMRDGYVSQLLMLVLLGTMALTVIDFVFKSTVAQSIATARLGHFFARFYLGLNIVALVVQLVGAGWLLRTFGARRGSSLLPALAIAGAAGLVLGPILPFAVALKAFDGSFRHTLYRSAVELLYLPLDCRRRERAKTMIEVLGHRVGQAAASLLIFLGISFGLSPRQLGAGLLALALGWLAAIMSTHRRYVDQFRSHLRIVRTSSDSQAVEPEAVLDGSPLADQLTSSLMRVIELLQRRAAIEADGSVQTADVESLRLALREKEQAALERAFSLMALQQPEENFALLWHGLRSGDPRLQAASAEVLEASLTGPIREAVLAIVDDGNPAAKRARMASAALWDTFPPPNPSKSFPSPGKDRSGS
jgi:AAA family ATP:ADP antiporter